jgi:hypothetical protein
LQSTETLRALERFPVHSNDVGSWQVDEIGIIAIGRPTQRLEGIHRYEEASGHLLRIVAQTVNKDEAFLC